MKNDTTSTPITAEGLRGLGMTVVPEQYGGDKLITVFNHDDEEGMVNRLCVYRWTNRGSWVVAASRRDDDECTDEVFLGTAPDLEAVARLIDVLKRMNGGG